jgi:hypothetical protein
LHYLKEYETVVKNSRRHEDLPLKGQKQELDELISEFLSDLPSSQDEQGSTAGQLDAKLMQEQQSPQQPVQVQHIDLS